MIFRPALACHLLCLGILRCASLLVPTPQRADWWKEWHSELWHVRHACTPERGVCRTISWAVCWNISWAAERKLAAFCLGAFEDARCLREHAASQRLPHASRGSAAQCLLLLASISAVGAGIALLLPGLPALIHPPRYRDAPNLMLIDQVAQSGQSDDATQPTISTAQYLTWKHRRQSLFDALAFYRIVTRPLQISSRHRPAIDIAYASTNLFDLLGLPIRFAPHITAASTTLPKLILSQHLWRTQFAADPNIFGRVLHLGKRNVVVAGIAPEGAWRLPGAVSAWLLLDPASGSSNPSDPVSNPSEAPGYVVAHLTPASANAQWGQTWHMTAPTPDGSGADFVCSSIQQRMHRPPDIFLFAVILACLALPATTSLPLGEYRLSSRKLSWSTRLRRWSFLASKLALLLPIVFFLSLDLAHLRPALDPIVSEYIQLVSAFCICLFGLRWTLRDQRLRCPVCLGKLAHPARVGQPSRSFLDWNGTELICIGGHGLLHVPEMATSWFSTQRWLYLDPSWQVLFAEPGLASAGYF